MSDLELQLKLAAMLPEKLTNRIELVSGRPKVFTDRILWKESEKTVKETEMLHVVWLIEKGMTEVERVEYLLRLDPKTNDWDWEVTHASWQRRAAALIAVKT